MGHYGVAGVKDINLLVHCPPKALFGVESHLYQRQAVEMADYPIGMLQIQFALIAHHGWANPAWILAIAFLRQGNNWLF